MPSKIPPGASVTGRMAIYRRLVASPVHEISLFIHLQYLHRYIQSGQRVLDGCVNAAQMEAAEKVKAADAQTAAK